MSTAKFVTLEDTVNHFIAEAGLTSASFFRLYGLAERGYLQIWRTLVGMPKTRLLTVLPNKTVELPSDYIDWAKVGVLNEKGEVSTLRRNEHLSAYAATDEDRIEAQDEVDVDTLLTQNRTTFLNYEDSTGVMLNLFGAPSGTENLGEFNVFDKDGVIVLDKEFQHQHIILEYIASPIERGKPVLIPVQVQEAIIAWLGWTDIRYMPSSRRVNNGEKIIRKREYYHQRKLARRELRRMRSGEVNDTIRLNNNLVLKP